MGDLCPSARLATLPLGAPCAPESIETQVGEQQHRPLKPPTRGFLSFQEAKRMPAAGRPRGTNDTVIKERTHDFIRRIASGEDFAKAAEDAKLQPVRALAILSQPEVRDIIKAAA